MIDAVKRGVILGLIGSATVLAFPLAWNLGIWISSLIHAGPPPGEVYLDIR